MRWRSIRSVVVQGTQKTVTLVGFLEHRHSGEDPDGLYLVFDRDHDERGFVLPGGAAYVYVTDPQGDVTTRQVENLGLLAGIQKILEVPGDIELAALPKG
jgi:hypothetical protein